MLKRVLAWVLLAGFVFLLLNIMVFQFYVIPSISLYLIIALGFVFSKKSRPEQNFEQNRNRDTE